MEGDVWLLAVVVHVLMNFSFHRPSRLIDKLVLWTMGKFNVDVDPIIQDVLLKFALKKLAY